ncbi:MAG: hypothetical protein KBD05_00695 [Candidatus Pacebacteria bacterium]|nr:hypothetical protein [Candidatus Paceibacterota bacterium]
MAAPARQYPQPQEEEEVPQPVYAANDNRRQAPKPKKGIGTLVAIALIVVAFSFDGLQFLANLLHVMGPTLATVTGGAAGMIAGFVVGALVFIVVSAVTLNPVAGGVVGAAAGTATGAAVSVAVSTLGVVASSALAMMIPFWIGILSQIVFGVWFALLGKSYKRNFATRIMIHMSMFVTELLPLINALPGITLGVVALILLYRAEAMYGKDVKGIPLSKLGSLIKGQLPRVKRDINQARPPWEKEASEADTTSRQWGPQGTYKDQVLANAAGIDLAGHKFFDVEARYRRRYGVGSDQFREVVRNKINQERGGQG